ncbi:MAG: hypothetical protein R3E79_47705 [Caldilineaceae bacterium]
MFLLPLLLLLIIGFELQRRQRNRRRKQTLTQQLYTWADQTLTLDPELQQWIHRLPAAEASVLVNLLTGYCTSLNWELAWLFAPQIERAPVLKQALEESVSAYARAILTSLQMEEDVRAYQVYLAFARKPTARHQRRLVQRLYPKVQTGKGGLGAAEPREWRFLPKFSTGKKNKANTRPPTHKEQIAAIQRAFDQNPVYAMEALKEVLAEEAAQTIAQARQTMHTRNIAPLSAAA